MDDVWDAITSAERIPRWFLRFPAISVSAADTDCRAMRAARITLRAPAPARGTWEFGGNVTWLTVRLMDDASGGTRLDLEHIAHVPDELWDQFGPGAVGVGWDMTLIGLDRHFATGAAVNPQDAAAWIASDNGKEFVARSSQDWCRASIAAGTDQASATAAAKRTTAFYTGEPPADG